MSTTPGFTSEVLANGVEVIAVSEPDLVDAEEIAHLRDDIVARIGAIGTPRIVLDLGQVQYLASAALAMLLVIRSAIETHEGAMGIARVTPDLREVFRVTGLNRRFALHESVEEAVDDVLAQLPT